MKSTTHQLSCGKCQVGEVAVIIKETRSGTEMSVKKCNSCKYQYGIKQISENKEMNRVLQVSTKN